MATQELNLEALKKDIDALKNDIKGIVSTLKEIGEQKLEAKKDKLLEHLNAEEVKKYLGELKAKGECGAQTISETVKKEPVKSLAIVAGLGLILGWMLRK